MNRRVTLLPQRVHYTRVEYLESQEGGQNDVRAYIQLPFDYDLTQDTIAFETEHELLNTNLNMLELYSLDGHALNWGYLIDGGYVIRYDSDDSTVEKTHSFTQTDGFHVWHCECSPKYLNMYVDGVRKVHVDFARPLLHRKKWPLTVFGVITDSNEFYSSWPLLGKKKYFKAWKNGQLIYSLIPAVDSAGIPCMCNELDETLYYSLGMNDFIAGPVIMT